MTDGVEKGGIEPADTVAMRHAMVASQLRTTGVDDERVVTAMANLPREPFVPAASRNLAYRDTAIPLGGGRYLNTPMATARLLTEAEILPDDRVLLIGAATGYAAAILARLGARVTAVEEVPALAAAARDTLAGLDAVEVVEGPLAEGHAADRPDRDRIDRQRRPSPRHRPPHGYGGGHHTVRRCRVRSAPRLCPAPRFSVLIHAQDDRSRSSRRYRRDSRGGGNAA
jgi:SAM-dependent methyltransferase